MLYRWGYSAEWVWAIAIHILISWWAPAAWCGASGQCAMCILCYASFVVWPIRSEHWTNVYVSRIWEYIIVINWFHRLLIIACLFVHLRSFLFCVLMESFFFFFLCFSLFGFSFVSIRLIFQTFCSGIGWDLFLFGFGIWELWKWGFNLLFGI